MTTKKCSVLVIGAGPGGYVAAIRAGQLGLDTIIVESEKAGGTCLIRGCIPSKAIIHAANKFHEMGKHTDKGHMGIRLPKPATISMSGVVRWKEGIVDKLNKGVEHLLKSAGVELITGWADFKSPNTCEVKSGRDLITIEAEHVILANGSTPIELPFMPFENDVISSRDALNLKKLPEDLVVIGGGYIGLELGCAYAMMGSNVTVIEAMDSVLPLFDDELKRPVQLFMRKNGVKIMTNCLAKSAEKNEGKTIVTYEDSSGNAHTINADKVLVTVGRKPNSQNWGIENMGVELDEKGFVKIDDKCATNVNNVWCIGDLSGEPMLAHRASAQGEMVAEIISGKNRIFDPVAIPAIVFTEPEIVCVGQSPSDAEEEGIQIITGKFPLAANGRALTMEAEKTGGFLRVVARKDNHEIIGIQCVGSHVSELCGEFILAMEMGAVLEDISGTIHPHPTLGESFHEGVLSTLGHAIHIVK